MKTFFTLILVGLIAYGAFYIGQKYQGKPSSLTPPAVATPTTPPSEASNTTSQPPIDDELTLEEAIQQKSVEKIALFLAPNVNFSRFESEYNKTLAQGAAAVEISKYLNESEGWQTDQNNAAIKKIKESNAAFFSDSWVIIDSKSKALAFTFDQDIKILNVIYISNYPAFFK